MKAPGSNAGLLGAICVVAALLAAMPARAATLLVARAGDLDDALSTSPQVVAQGMTVDPNRLFGACAPLLDAGIAVWRSVDDSCAGWDDADPGSLPAMNEPVRGANGFRVEQVLAMGLVVAWDTELRIACLPGSCDDGLGFGEPPDALFSNAFED
jgi:hypothetical protein